MEIREVKANLGKIVYYDTKQINFESCSIKDFIFSAYILRKNGAGRPFYQAELTDPANKKITHVVPLEKVLTADKL